MESFGFEYRPSGPLPTPFSTPFLQGPARKPIPLTTPAPLPPSFARPPCHAPPLQSNVQVA